MTSHERVGALHNQAVTATMLSNAALVLILTGTALSCSGSRHTGSPAAGGLQSEIANLHAFARLYGVLRWFHPSDAAAIADWDRVAVEGVRRVIKIPSAMRLRTDLVELFAPVAPTVQIVLGSEQFAPISRSEVPESGLELVAWQHKGFGDTSLEDTEAAFASKRLNRARTVPAPRVPFLALSQAIDARATRGARIRLRGKLRTAGHALGKLWLRVDRENGTGFFDNMDEHPVINPQWASAEIVGEVASDATRIVLGILMDDTGTTWYDDLELAVEQPDHTWKQLEIQNPGFEQEKLSPWRPGTGRSEKDAPTDGWRITLDRQHPASGSAALRVEPERKIVSEELFDSRPREGETVDIELGSGLRARVPITLRSMHGHTVGDDATSVHNTHLDQEMLPAASFDVNWGIADVVVVWNVLEHFWPYWGDVSVDWDSQLEIALADALDDRSVDDHVRTLERLSAKAPDAHASTTCPGMTPGYGFPFRVKVIDGQVVVTASAVANVQRGDIVISLEGKSAMSWIADIEQRTSGSPQWRRVLASYSFGAAAYKTPVPVTLKRRGEDIETLVSRGDAPPGEFEHASIERLSDGVYYVDLHKTTLDELRTAVHQLAAAPGVVFDVRQYPQPGLALLSYLTTRQIDANEGMTIPHWIRPAHRATSAPIWESESLLISALQPHIAGRVAFVAGPLTVSKGESILSMIEHYQLGQIVGATTAGTNGNVAQITTPSRCHTTFTAMRVRKPGGARLHLVGIQPTIPVEQTIDGVRSGRDEVLERALAYVRSTK